MMKHCKLYKVVIGCILTIGIIGSPSGKPMVFASEEYNFGETYDTQDYGTYKYTSIGEFKEIVSPWSFDYLETYVEYNEIPEVDDTIKKAKDIIDTCLNFDTCVKVRKKASWGKTYYTQTKSDSGLYYAGEIEDGRPNGIGMLIEVFNTYEHNIIRKKYMGEFNKGVITGFGLQFSDDEIHTDVYSQLNEIENEEDSQLAFDNYFNPISYIGEFKKGECTGEGVSLIYRDITDLLDLLSYGASMQELDSNKIFMSDIIIAKGEHKKGKWNGDIKMYVNGQLLYDGEMEDDLANGEGRLYYPDSDVLKYEGGFKEGDYNGKGTEYSEEGKEIYSGNWKNGDYDS